METRLPLGFAKLTGRSQEMKTHTKGRTHLKTEPIKGIELKIEEQVCSSPGVPKLRTDADSRGAQNERRFVS